MLNWQVLATYKPNSFVKMTLKIESYSHLAWSKCG